MPFLNYGLGEDRLGGAKMTFLDSNVVLKVVDSVQGNYKVQISKYHSAYIDKKHVSIPVIIKEKIQLSKYWPGRKTSVQKCNENSSFQN